MSSIVGGRHPGARRSCACALLAGLLLARQAVVSAWDTIWAEDGFAFLCDAVSANALAAVVEPHGGYIHPLPRAAAAVAAVLPLDLAAVVFSIAWALVVALLAAFVYGAAAGGRIRVARERGEPPLLPRLRVLLGVRLAKHDHTRGHRARPWSPSRP